MDETRQRQIIAAGTFGLPHSKMGTQTAYALLRAGYHNPEDLRGVSSDDLASIRGIGPVALAMLEEVRLPLPIDWQ